MVRVGVVVATSSCLSHGLLFVHLYARAVLAPACKDCTTSLSPSTLCYTEKATEARHHLERQYNACANRKKQCRPDETRSSPTRHTRAKYKMILQMVTPQAASSQVSHLTCCSHIMAIVIWHGGRQSAYLLCTSQD